MGTKLNPKQIQAMKDGKVPMDRIPYGPLAAVARVLDSGAFKYGVKNWRLDEIQATTYVGAIARHALLEWASGIDADKDTGEHPLAHVIACCLVVMDAEAYGTLVDDRLVMESIDGDTGIKRRVLPKVPRVAKSKKATRRKK